MFLLARDIKQICHLCQFSQMSGTHCEQAMALAGLVQRDMLTVMTAIARLEAQRAHGHITLQLGKGGVQVLREAGSAKCRIPAGSHEAVLINTSGGLAGGDRLTVEAEALPGASLTMTTQAAERAYRTLGATASVDITLRAGSGSRLFWMPQELIMFEGSAVARRISVDLAGDATFLAVESLILGRTERGESVEHTNLSDSWDIRQDGRLIHAERFRLGPDVPASAATLGPNKAMATLLFIGPGSASLLPGLRRSAGDGVQVSEWNGKLIARFLVRDGFHLRKSLIPAISACVGPSAVPKVWTF